MRQYISGKWLEYGGVGYGYRCYYYHKLVYNSDLKLTLYDEKQTSWTIGKDIEIDLWISWSFDDHERDRSRIWKSNDAFVVSIENTNTGTKGAIVYSASSLGLTNRVGDGIIPLKFKPEDVGITVAGRFPVKIEIEAFAVYETEVTKQTWDSLYDWNTSSYLYPANIPLANDSLSIEKNGDRPNVNNIQQWGFPVWMMVNHRGELNPIIQNRFITIVSNVPTVDFSSDVTSGIAPLHVSFTNLSQSPDGFPITYCRWYFGDGTSSSAMGISEVVPHIFTTPGTYSVTLTVGNGSRTAYKTKTIVVSTSVCVPEFIDGTYLPQASYPGSPIVLKFNIKNNGGAGKIYIKSLCKGVYKTIASSITLPEYSTGKLITMPAYNLEWYCGYKPTAETPVNILFEVGREGGGVTDNISWDTFEIGTALNCTYPQVPNEAGTACVDAPITETECASMTGWHWNEDTLSCVKDSSSSKTWIWAIVGIGSALLLVGGGLLLKSKLKR